MFILEPIPQISAMFLALRMAKAQDGPLGAELSAIESRTKSTKSGDRAAWLQIYKDVSALLPRLVELYARPEPRTQKTAPMPAHRVSSAVTSAQGALQRAATDWTTRLASQERDLARKAAEAAEKLPVVSSVDETMGEMVYAYEAAELGAYWEWLGEAERTWTSNNRDLVAVRAQEAAADALAELPLETSFRVGPAPLEPTGAPPPRLRGHRIPNPGFFQSLGSTYRFVMSGVTAISGLGFFATRVLGGAVATVLPIVLGTVFVGTVIVAAITLPKQRRQTMARLKARAAEVLQRELSDAVRERLKSASEAQLSAIKKHLSAEATRLKVSVRDLVPSSGDVAAERVSLAVGLSPGDIAKLRGEWKDAVEERIRQIEGELGAGTRPMA